MKCRQTQRTMITVSPYQARQKAKDEKGDKNRDGGDTASNSKIPHGLDGQEA